MIIFKIFISKTIRRKAETCMGASLGRIQVCSTHDLSGESGGGGGVGDV